MPNRSLVRAALALSAAALICGQSPAPPPEESLPPALGLVVVDAQIDRNRRMSVPVTINGAGP